MAKELITGAEILMRSLVDRGVTTLFGYPGGAIMPVFDALYDYRDKLNHILVRHEQGAAHAAEGYARVSGKVGVCLVTSGPGAAATRQLGAGEWRGAAAPVGVDSPTPSRWPAWWSLWRWSLPQ